MTPLQAVEAFEDAKFRLLKAALCFVTVLEASVHDPKSIKVAVDFARELIKAAAELRAAENAMRSAVGRLVL